jgi:hypothetical protein
MGIGVTAHSAEDVKAIVRSTFGDEVVLINVELIRDMRLIEQRHVVPNMEPNWLLRGVWYPAGFR